MRWAAAFVLLNSAGALASPNLPLDHPAYETLSALYRVGRVAPYLGGLRPLSASRAKRLLAAAGEDAAASLLTVEPDAWWAALYEMRFGIELVDDERRLYTTLVHPRDIVGGVAVSCERREGEPCGDGFAAVAELEATGGFGSHLAAVARTRVWLGTADHASAATLDRAYLRGELGPIDVQLGRDAFALGPSERTQLGWGTHAPPLNHLRITTEHPWVLNDGVALSGQYVLGVLAAPQTFPNNLVSITRGQADLAGTIEIGLMQMLQLGGEGAAELGPVDFLLEHLRRRDPSASASDSSNRRFGGDVAARIVSLRGLRLYYAVMFEDIRRARVIDAIRYDADHLFGFEVALLNKHSVTVEWHKTGVRSQEHTPRTTGFTNGGRVVGDPLGPDAESLYAHARIATERASFYPWFELARLMSDTYLFVDHGPITRTSRGEDEARYRAGLGVRVPLHPSMWIEGEAMVEHVEDFAFVDGVTRNNAGVIATMVWYPDAMIGRLLSK